MKESKFANTTDLHSPIAAYKSSPARQGSGPTTLWSQEEGRLFFNAFQKFNTPNGANWQKVAKAVGTKDATACEALHQRFQTYLSLPKGIQHQVAFLAMVRDMHNHVTKADGSAETLSDEGDTGVVAADEPASEGGTSSPQLHSAPRARRTPRPPMPSIVRSSARGSTLRSPEVLTPSLKKRDAEEEDHEVSTHTSWGGRGKRGVAPSALAESVPSKRKRVQTRLQFLDESPKDMRRRGLMDAGDADGADALLSLAALANAEEDDDLPGLKLPASAQRELEEKLESLAAQAAEAAPSRPRRSRTTPAKADDSPPPPPPSARKKAAEAPSSSAKKKREKEKEKEPVEESPKSASTEQPEKLGRGRRARGRPVWRKRGRADSSSDFTEPEDSEGEKPEKPRRGSGYRPRAGRLNNLLDRGYGANAGSAEENPKANGPEDDFAASDAFWHGLGNNKEPTPRMRRRKALPEKIPPMMSPIKSLFGRRTNAGLMLGLPGQGAAPGGLPGVCFPGMEGEENGSSPGEPELRLRRCLDARTRRWAAAEFFCCAVDRPWLMQNELEEFLQHVGIPEGTKLTKTEWAALRAALGTPRRLSLNFLREERGRLESWRNLVRQKYEEVGNNGDVPADLPRQLTVSQRVTARHPVTRQLHDGDILTVAPNCYRVQFDRRELGVELVKDVDVMPIDPTESLPSGLLVNAGMLILNGRRALAGGPIIKKQQRAWRVENGSMRGPAAGRAQQEARAAAAAAAAQQQLRSEADVRALLEVNSVLDRKEALLRQLRTMNDEAEADMHLDSSGRHTEAFQAAYAQVVLDLKEVNEVLEMSLGQLQARNIPHAEALAAALNRTASTEKPGSSSLILPNSPLRARAAEAAGASEGLQQGIPQQSYPSPEAAWQAAWMEGRRLVQKYQAELTQGTWPAGKAAPAGSDAAATAGTERAGTPMPEDAASALSSQPSTGTEGQMLGQGDPAEAEWLSHLVNGCVSMLITVHQCTEKEASPQYVQSALDYALASLTPRVAANRPFLAEIQNSVDLLKQHLMCG